MPDFLMLKSTHDLLFSALIAASIIVILIAALSFLRFEDEPLSETETVQNLNATIKEMSEIVQSQGLINLETSMTLNTYVKAYKSKSDEVKELKKQIAEMQKGQ